MDMTKTMILEYIATVAVDCHDCLVNLDYNITSGQFTGDKHAR